MATVTKRGKRWYVQVRRKGFPPRYKTFGTKSEALAWARLEEAIYDPAQRDAHNRPETTLGELLARYRDTIAVNKLGASSESYRLSRMVAAPMASVALHELLPEHIAAYRDERLRKVKPGTVRRELAVLRSALAVGQREWGLTSANPAAVVRRPSAHDARDRRLRSGEWERIRDALRRARNPELFAFLQLAIETALRRGELLDLSWANIDLTRRVALIPETKGGRPRTIPLTPRAVQILEAMRGRSGRVFSLTGTGVHQAWKRACRRAGVEGLRIHDLRHEALSRFSELGLNTPELAAISGHRDVRMLLRYTHVQPAQLARKLSQLTERLRAASGGN